MKNLNGWLITTNNYDGFPSKKPWLAFHPIHDGHHWQDFDTYNELSSFCTREKLDEWDKELAWNNTIVGSWGILFYEEEESVESILSDLYDVGIRKSLGYLPLSTLKDICKTSIQDIKDFAIKKGLGCVLYENVSSSGEIYVYHEKILMDILKTNKDILLKAGIPIENVLDYIKYIAHVTIYQEKYPEAYAIIGKTFNDSRFNWINSFNRKWERKLIDMAKVEHIRQSILETISMLDGIKETLQSGLWYFDETGGAENTLEEQLLKNIKLRAESLNGITEEFKEKFQDKWDESQED